MKRLGFNIVMLGMIASGKETQANILKKKYPLKFVETGVYSRKLLKEKSKDGEQIRAWLTDMADYLRKVEIVYE